MNIKNRIKRTYNTHRPKGLKPYPTVEVVDLLNYEKKPTHTCKNWTMPSRTLDSRYFNEYFAGKPFAEM